MAGIISRFEISFRASGSSINLDDLTNFDLHFFCDSPESIPEIIEVIVGNYCYQVKLVVNFSALYNPFADYSSSQSDDHGNLGDLN